MRGRIQRVARRRSEGESVNGRDPPAGAGLISWHIPLEDLPPPFAENTHVGPQGRQVVLRDGDAAAVISSWRSKLPTTPQARLAVAPLLT